LIGADSVSTARVVVTLILIAAILAVSVEVLFADTLVAGALIHTVGVSITVVVAGCALIFVADGDTLVVGVFVVAVNADTLMSDAFVFASGVVTATSIVGVALIFVATLLAIAVPVVVADTFVTVAFIIASGVGMAVVVASFALILVTVRDAVVIFHMVSLFTGASEGFARVCTNAVVATGMATVVALVGSTRGGCDWVSVAFALVFDLGKKHIPLSADRAVTASTGCALGVDDGFNTA
jgi:hypothetical protein